MVVKRSRTPRPTMVTISDAETTETARQESMRESLPPERATMPAPPAAIGRFSIEMNVSASEVDYKALFERGAFREALLGARERLSVSPADTSALRIAQRSEEALVERQVTALGGPAARVMLARDLPETDSTVRERLLLRRFEHGPITLQMLLDGDDLGRIEALDLLVALQARGHVRVNLSG